jgi:2-C-methyl-D-erythritol 2,4-cyclodiphosphate synthase
MRIGIGYDFHRLVKGRKIHAVCDALLGAAGCGDIGRHFPDTDLTLKGVSSIKLLKNTYQIINTKSHTVLNVDATIMAEAPRLQPYLESMKQNIAETLGIDQEQINVKASTTEGLGIIGKGEGMAALSVALID